MNNFDKSIKYFLKENMYQNKSVLVKTLKGKKIIRLLFDKIKNKPLKFIKKEVIKKNGKERSICDFIAGMTDRYAINLFNSLK